MTFKVNTVCAIAHQADRDGKCLGTYWTFLACPTSETEKKKSQQFFTNQSTADNKIDPSGF